MAARHPDAAYRQDPVGTGSSAESGIVDSGYRLDVVAPGTADVSDPRPMQILGVGTGDLESALKTRRKGKHPHAVAVESRLYNSDARVRSGVHAALGHRPTEVSLWGDPVPPELHSDVRLVQHRSGLAARAFKAQALAAAGVATLDVAAAGNFCTGRLCRPRLQSDLLPAGRIRPAAPPRS